MSTRSPSWLKNERCRYVRSKKRPPSIAVSAKVPAIKGTDRGMGGGEISNIGTVPDIATAPAVKAITEISSKDPVILRPRIR